MRNAGLVEREIVRVPLDQDRLPGLPDGVLAHGQAIEQMPLGVERRVGRVEILGVDVEERPSAEADDLPGQPGDGEDDPAAEAVVVVPRLLARQDQAGLFQQLGRNPFGLEVGGQAVPGVGRVADLEVGDDILGHAALLEVFLGLAPLRARGQALAEEGQGRLVQLDDLLLQLESLGAQPPLVGDGDVVALGQGSQGLGKGQVLLLHDQGEDVAADPAAEAVVELLVGIHGERGGLLAVERAQSDMLATAGPQGRVLRGDLDDVGGLADLFDDFHG